MNYIAHLHLAQSTSTSLLGNFLGDFVRGSDLSQWSPEVQQGVRLHRKIDQFTDQHSAIRALKVLFPSHLRKTAGIALDIYFDHLLMHRWQQFSEVDSQVTFEHFYRQLDDWQLPVNPRFDRVRRGLLQHRWLADYQQKQTCLRAMHSIEQRLKYKIVFAEQSFLLIDKNSTTIEREFSNFYPQLVSYSRQFIFGADHGR